MEKILTAATLIVPLVMAATGMVKKSFVNDNKWLPYLNVIIGLLIGLLYATTIVKGDFEIYCWAGFISGLAAGGFYDLGVNTVGFVNQKRAAKLADNGEGKQDIRDGE